jgi:hypothetical protein
MAQTKKYMRIWREKNKNHRKEYMLIWREKNKKKRQEYAKNYRAKHKAEISEWHKNYREKNREAHNRRAREWRAKHKKPRTIKTGKSHPCWKGFQDLPFSYFAICRRGAKSRSIPFEITIQDMWNLYVKQNKRCALTNLPIGFGKNKTASLDRIDSNLGYTINNIQWLHKHINIMKQYFDNTYFCEMCKLVAQTETTWNVLV